MTEQDKNINIAFTIPLLIKTGVNLALLSHYGNKIFYLSYVYLFVNLFLLFAMWFNFFKDKGYTVAITIIFDLLCGFSTNFLFHSVINQEMFFYFYLFTISLWLMWNYKVSKSIFLYKLINVYGIIVFINSIFKFRKKFDLYYLMHHFVFIAGLISINVTIYFLFMRGDK